MKLFAREEKDLIAGVWANGFDLRDMIDINDLTMSIWEAIAKVPYPITTTFNLLGNSSIINVMDESNDVVLRLHIDKQKIEFRLFEPKPSRDDTVAAAFATMATMGVINKMCN